MSRRRWTIALGIVGALLAVRFARSFPWSRTFEALGTADWLLLGAAAGVNIVSLAVKGAAWQLLLRRLAPVRLGTAQVATFFGAAVNSISVSVSGDAARARIVSRDGVSFGAAVASLVATRIVEAAGLVVFLAAALVALPPWPGARTVGFALGGTAAALTAGSSMVPWRRVPSRGIERWHESFRRLACLDAPGPVAGAIALTSISWLAQWFTYHWSIAATHTPVTAGVSLTTLVLANIGGILRLTPGNIGVMQGSLILGMRAFNISAAAALAAGLALQAVEVLPILAIGIALAGAERFSRPAGERMWL